MFIVSAYVLRFKNNLLNKIKKKDVTVGELSLDELNNAEYMWLKSEQIIIKTEDKFSLLKKSLHLFEDANHLLRVGCFGNCDLQYQEKYPVLLRRHSHYTLLVVTETHHLVMHSGLEVTLSRIRNRFWIISGRQTVKSILMKCVTCLRWRGKPMLQPPSPDLPAYRIVSTNGFQSTGIDHASPLFVKGIYSKSSELN